MSFHDLPSNWTERSLADESLAVDVVDLVLPIHDRVTDSLLLIPCDAQGRGQKQVVIINDLDWFCTAKERLDLFKVLAQTPCPRFVFAVSSRFDIPAEVATRWRGSAERVFASAPGEIIGFFRASADSIVPVAPKAAA